MASAIRRRKWGNKGKQGIGKWVHKLGNQACSRLGKRSKEVFISLIDSCLIFSFVSSGEKARIKRSLVVSPTQCQGILSHIKPICGNLPLITLQSITIYLRACMSSWLELFAYCAVFVLSRCSYEFAVCIGFCKAGTVRALHQALSCPPS